MLNRYVKLPPFDASTDDILAASVPLNVPARVRAAKYIIAMTQSARWWRRLLEVLLNWNHSFLGLEDALALQSLAVHHRIFCQVFERLEAFGEEMLVESLTACWTQMEELRLEVERTADNWGVVADGASSWLPSRAPVALMAGCLLRRASDRSISEYKFPSRSVSLSRLLNRTITNIVGAKLPATVGSMLADAWSAPPDHAAFEEAPNDGYPRTFTLCSGRAGLGGHDDHVSVGATLPVWPRGSWLDKQARKLRPAELSLAGSRALSAIDDGYTWCYQAQIAEGKDNATARRNVAFHPGHRKPLRLPRTPVAGF
jgi:hypothetical protein